MRVKYPNWAPSEGGVLCGLAIVTPITAAVAPLLIGAPGIAAAAIILLRRFLHRTRLVTTPSHPFALTTLCLALWGCTSALWSVNETQSVLAALRILAISCVLIVLLSAALNIGPEDSHSVREFLAFGMILGVLVTLLRTGTITAITIWINQEEMAAHKLSALNRTAGILAILVWPSVFCLAKSFGQLAAGAFLGITFIAILLLGPTAPSLALGLGACGFLVAWFNLRLASTLVCASFIASIAVIPFFPQLSPWASQFLIANVTDNTAEIHRFVIWQFAAEHVLQRPFLGWGLDTARIFPGGDTELFINTTAEGVAVTAPAMPLHTHNAALQIWLELGIVGLLLWSTLFLLTIRHLGTNTRLYAAATIGTLNSALVVAHLCFGIWQGWWLATLGMTVVFMVAIRKHDTSPSSSTTSLGMNHETT